MSSRDKRDLVFKALAHEKRREILDFLRDKPRTTGAICDHFKALDRCTTMQHLGVLEKAGLVLVQREGRVRWNYLNVYPLKQIYDRWISRYATEAVDLLARMKRDMERN